LQTLGSYSDRLYPVARGREGEWTARPSLSLCGISPCLGAAIGSGFSGVWGVRGAWACISRTCWAVFPEGSNTV
jgi:hypothetical protein